MTEPDWKLEMCKRFIDPYADDAWERLAKHLWNESGKRRAHRPPVWYEKDQVHLLSYVWQVKASHPDWTQAQVLEKAWRWWKEVTSGTLRDTAMHKSLSVKAFEAQFRRAMKAYGLDWKNLSWENIRARVYDFSDSTKSLT